MIKTFHIALALASVSGFILRLGWSYTAPQLNAQRWVRVAPHVVDTMLLALGVWLALQLAGGPWQPWLGVKLCGLLAYIGFGVLALRGSGAAKHVGAVAALCAAGYIFFVALTRQIWF